MRLLHLADNELVERLCKGHDKAFEVLFCRYKSDISNVIANCVRDRLVTEDLSQDIFIRIYTSLKSGKYSEQGTFQHWALRIARNMCMDYLRRTAKFSRSNIELYEDCLCTTPNQSVESRLTAKQTAEQLYLLVNRLPDDQKKVICYRFFEDQGYKEIALLMNTSVSTSLGRMRYGLTRLRRQLISEHKRTGHAI